MVNVKYYLIYFVIHTTKTYTYQRLRTEKWGFASEAEVLTVV